MATFTIDQSSLTLFDNPQTQNHHNGIILQRMPRDILAQHGFRESGGETAESRGGASNAVSGGAHFGREYFGAVSVDDGISAGDRELSEQVQSKAKARHIFREKK